MIVRDGDLMVNDLDKCEDCKYCFNCERQEKVRHILVGMGEEMEFHIMDCGEYMLDREYIRSKVRP